MDLPLEVRPARVDGRRELGEAAAEGGGRGPDARPVALAVGDDGALTSARTRCTWGIAAVCGVARSAIEYQAALGSSGWGTMWSDSPDMTPW